MVQQNSDLRDGPELEGPVVLAFHYTSDRLGSNAWFLAILDQTDRVNPVVPFEECPQQFLSFLSCFARPEKLCDLVTESPDEQPSET